MAPLRVSSGENSTPLADDTSITILMFNARFNLPSLHFGSCAAAAYNLRLVLIKCGFLLVASRLFLDGLR
ncbi:hypothetical protein Csa_012726 [Cucumis sativus]|nr:hypothetical protein Csa_012726 [Cucumis sativus]